MAHPGFPERPPGSTSHTIESLRLDVPAAMEGKTWILLPEGFRSRECGKTYPLPTRIEQLQKIVAIPIAGSNLDSGDIYIQRAIDNLRARLKRRHSQLLDLNLRSTKIDEAHHNFRRDIKLIRERAHAEVERIKLETDKAVASLKDLFALGRQGLEGQMKAHLEDGEWQGEKISAHAFRECFRLVSQAVKGLGIPSDQKTKAREAVLEEAAAALKDTQEALSMAPGSQGPEMEH